MHNMVTRTVYMLLILSFRRSAIRTVAAAATNDITGGTLVRGQPAAGQSSRSVAMSSLSHMVTAAQAVTDCDSDYLKLDFVCDPSRLLSHTEAALLNRTIPEGFSYCSRNSGSFSTDSRGYNFGIVLLRSLYAPDLDRCRGARPSGTRPNMKAKNATVLLVLEQRLLQQKADLMRQLWNERLVHCSVDILVIMVQTVYFCIKNSMVVRPSKSRRLAIGVSLSQRLKSMVSEQDVVKDYQSFSDFTDVSGLIDGVTVKDILKLFRVLDVLLPSVSAVPPGDKPAASALPRHYIPEWASVLFAVCLILTIACTLLGQWLNTSHRKRIFRPNQNMNARPAPKRRWRAGFGGGLIELRGNQPVETVVNETYQDYSNYRS